ncbi:MAG: toxin TcdB middle/N-terminal domain-containing protein, partial [bacterium]
MIALSLAITARADTDTSYGDRSGEGSTPFTGLAQAPEANLFTGALGTAITFAVPPGHKNATPSLALRYSSSGGPSPFGYGWDLPIGRIERTTKWGVPRCTSSHFNEFVLTLPGTAAELVNDPPNSATYRPMVEESYVNVELDQVANTWTVQDRAGMRYIFGATVGSRIGTDPSVFKTVSGGVCSYTTAWALTKIIDPNGNTIEFSWGNTLNQLVPAGVKYGGNDNTGADYQYAAAFFYEARPDVLRSYRHGEAAYMWLRLNRVVVATRIPTDTPIATYRMRYDDTQAGHRSLLTSVETSGRPTQTFVYAPSAAGHAAPTTFSAPRPFLRSHNDSLEVQNTVLDMNGDGLLDFVHYASPWQVYFGANAGGSFGFESTPTNWTTPSGQALGFGAQIRNVEVNQSDCPGDQYALAACTVADTFDITGDGIADYVVASTNLSDWRVYPGRRVTGGWGFDTVYIPWSAPSQRVRHTRADGKNIRDVVDMNADGLPDLVIANQDPWQVYLNTGSGFESTPVAFAPPSGLPANSGIPTMLVDFNGDGLPDYILAKQGNGYSTGAPECLVPTTPDYAPYSSGAILYLHGCMFVYFNTGSGFEATPKNIDTANTAWFGEDANHETGADLLDINGDGLPDFVERWGWNDTTHVFQDQWVVRLNTGGDLEPLTVSTYGTVMSALLGETIQSWGYASRLWVGGQGSIRTTKNQRDIIDMVDVDGDGLLDRVVAGTTGHEATNPTSWSVQRNRAGAYNAAGSEPSQRPNLLTMMSNGFGATNTIAYRPSTAYDNTGEDQQPDLPFISWVVEKTRLSDGQCTPPPGDVFSPASNPCIASGNELVTKYRYMDGRFDGATREFRGFRQVERISEEARRDDAGSAIDDLDNSTITVFGQLPGTIGRVLTSNVYSGAACPATNPEPDCSTPALVHSVQNQWSTATVGNSRTQAWLAQSETRTDDGVGTPLYVRVANQPPDTYGNISESAKYNQANALLVATHTDYALPATTGGPQILNRPRQTRTWDGSGTLAEQWFYYDSYTTDGDNGRIGVGNLRRVKSRQDNATPNGPESWTTYDAYGNVTQTQDPNGHLTTTYYDAYNLHPNRVVNHLNQQTLTEVDYRFGLPTKVTDPNGAVSSTNYDALGRRMCAARPGEDLANCPIGYEYHFAVAPETLSWVKVSEKQDSNPPSGCGGTATPRPPLWTQQLVDALGRVRYSDSGRVVDEVAATLRSNRTEFDAAGRVLKVWNPYLAGATPAAADAERKSYRMDASAPGRIDPLGRVRLITHPDGGTRSFTYQGDTTVMTDEGGTVSELVADALGRVVETRVKNAGSVYARTSSTFDGLGRLLTLTQNGSATPLKSITYDTLGRKTTMVDLDSGTWTYGYDAVGNLAWQNDPKSGQHDQYCYDALNRPSRTCTWADDSPTSHNCASTCPDPTKKVQYYYDGDDGWTVANSKGRLTRIIDGSGQNDVLTYDVRGQETKSRKSITVDSIERHAVFEYAYDSNGRVTSTTYPDGEQVFTEYDDSGQPFAVRSATQFYVINSVYDRFGRPTKIQHGNDVVDTWNYGPAGFGNRLSGLQTKMGTTRYLDILYDEYDPRGLLTKLRDLRDPLGDRSNTADYAYDHMGRLTSFDSAVSAADRIYEYNAFGNITRNGNQYFEYDTLKPHQMMKVHLNSPTGSFTSVTHDANGNRDAKAGQSYTFTAEDRVETLTAGGQVAQYIYDQAGRQVARKLGVLTPSVTRYYNALAETSDTTLTKWYFLGGQRIAMRQTANVTFETAALTDHLFRFANVSAERPAVVVLLTRNVGIALGLSGLLLIAALWCAPWKRRPPVVGLALRRGQIIAVALLWGTGTLPWPLLIQPDAAEAQTSDVIRHFHFDHLGSTQAITSATGTLLEQIRYSAYGEVRGRWNGANASITPTTTGRHEFTGYETQLDSGLQYAGARFYDPTLGSFLTHDPMAEFPNPYTYVHWDPVNSTDPSGACEFVCVASIILAVSGLVSSAVQSALNGAGPQQAVENSLVGALNGLTFQAGLIGPISNAFASAAPYIAAAQVAYGAYQTVDGFRSGQYVAAGFGAVVTAFGIVDLIQSGTQSSNGPRILAADDTNQLSDARDGLRGPFVFDEIVVEATRLEGLRSPFFDPIDLLAGIAVGAVVAGMIRGATIQATATRLEVAGVRSAANAARLSRQLASQEGVAEVLSGGGKVIAGRGVEAPLRAAKRLASEYGGLAEDWVKVTSTAPGHLQTHAY